jgi:cholesterol transport system auxiliary component
MKNPALPALLTGLLISLAACSSTRTDTHATLFDFGLLGPAPATQAPPALPALSVAEATAPISMHSPAMFYRLNYANAQQPQPYAQSRWSMPPAQLFVQRLKARIGQAGGTVVPATDGAMNIPSLRIDADEFVQVFDSPGNSAGQIALRASVLQGRTLVAQKSFSRQVPAPTPDAAGGAKALADASDAIISDIMSWLAGVPLKRQ